MANEPSYSYNEEFAFWTTERIRNAIPADSFLSDTAQPEQDQTYQPTAPIPGPGSSESASGAREISVDELTKAPYQSVGKLTVHGEVKVTDVKGKVTEKADLDLYATAFYIGNSTLLTVAHAFSRTGVSGNGGIRTFKETRGGTFTPAMIVQDQDPHNNYGKFVFRPGWLGGYLLHPRYDPLQRNAQYDVCKVTICKGIKNNLPIDSIDNIGLTPFKVHRDYNYTPQTTWRIVGYPGFPCGWHDYVNVDKMITTGMFEAKGMYRYSDQKELQINSRAEILPGMSGGPWIMGGGATMQEANMIVTGVQVGTLPSKDGVYLAVSPYLSSDWFHEMKLRVDDGNQVDMEAVP
jgi:hypothetical protein